MSQESSKFPFRLESKLGLCAQINSNGSIRRIDYKDIILNLFPGNELEGGLVNIYLRRLGDNPAFTPLLGPASPARYTFGKGHFRAEGQWQDIHFRVELILCESSPAWFWHVSLQNQGAGEALLDLIHTQDLAISSYGAVRQNEYYVSQYLDHTPLQHPGNGVVIATRQNQAMGGRNPWCVIGSLGKGLSYATDALQVYGLAGRQEHAPEGIVNGLPGERLQHEHAMAAIQDEPLCLRPGQSAGRGFFGWLEEHHPAATSATDLVFVEQALSASQNRIEAGQQQDSFKNNPVHSLFSTANSLPVCDLDNSDVDHLFGQQRRDEEYSDGHLLSFFTGSRTHVVLKSKDTRVLRPHGHILRSGGCLAPDEAALASTVYMDGVFHSIITQGHASINRFLSTTHSYLNLFRSHGQRIFIRSGDHGWQRLAMPSAFAMTPESCRWIYKHQGGLIEVISSAATDRHQLMLEINVIDGEAIHCLVASHVALNGDDGADARPVIYERQAEDVLVRAIPESDVGRRFPEGGYFIEPLSGTVIEQIGGDELLFADGKSRQQPYLTLITGSARTAAFSITGQLINTAELTPISADDYWRVATSGLTVVADGYPAIRHMAEILPWFAHNALIHFLTPRGLEQYSGGGWGTRDVTQGPVEYLFAIGQFAPMRDLLLRVFMNQNADGDWPQWFMFFERERNIRPNDSHGDIVFWPLVALAQYLLATGDASVLEEVVPFFHAESAQEEKQTLWMHAERALELIHNRLIPGTQLAAYGHGDWNDSLQPADPAMRERLCSAWTVTLHYQLLTTLAQALGTIGRAEQAGILETMAEAVLKDFRKYLFVDGVVSGYACFDEDGQVDYLLHPRDQRTGLSYSLLPMIHAIINDMLTPEEARQQLDLINRHLHGPDGAHLFDRPMAYRGGPMTIFQRAESSSYFGREIGIMYTHAHLRYAESLWHYGDAEAFLQALCQAIPIDIKTSVPSATRRQANCYYSSSDALFRDRYEAFAEYDKALSGDIPLEGGWRIYSSGAGIASSLILRCLFGIRPTPSKLIIDPVMPISLDGLTVGLNIANKQFEITYRVGPQGSGPASLELNGKPLAFKRLHNPYRTGGSEVAMSLLTSMLVNDINTLHIRLL